jgi:hypothetical protein
MVVGAEANIYHPQKKGRTYAQIHSQFVHARKLCKGPLEFAPVQVSQPWNVAHIWSILFLVRGGWGAFQEPQVFRARLQNTPLSPQHAPHPLLCMALSSKHLPRRNLSLKTLEVDLVT